MTSAPLQSEDAQWSKIAAIFSNWAYMRPNASWSFGVASRAGPQRLGRLTRSKAAGRLRPLIAGLGERDLARLIVQSDINLDQANGALRLTLVANISVPVGTVVLVNQMAPGYISNLFESVPGLAIGIPMLIALGILFLVIWYAYGGVAAARDLNHLLRLSYSAAAANPLRVEDGDEDAFGQVADMA